MSNVSVKPYGEYLNFGNCLELSNDKISLLVTVDVGPRIIRASLKDSETNMMKNDVNRDTTEEGEAFDKYYYPGAKWNIYGGHRLWMSPESLPETYYPDNDPVKYEITETGAIFKPNPQVQNGVQYVIEVSLCESDVTINHYITNISDKTLHFSPWALTVLNKGGLEIIPQNTRNTGLLANRKVIMWPYSNMADERLYFGEKYITLRQDDNVLRAFKMGLDNENGWAMYVLDDTVFVKSYPHFLDKEYEDFGVSFETYTNEHILEMETLGAKASPAPGETVLHTEKWSLYKNCGTPNPTDEAEVAKFVENYIK